MATAQEDTRLVLAISADIASLRRAMQEANLITKKTTDAVNDNFSKAGGAADRAAKQIENSMNRAGRQAQQVTRNIGFQLNDIAQGLLSGTSPFTIMAQQTAQVTQALDGLDRGTSKLGALASAFGSLLNWQTVVTAAVIYGTGALVQYFTAGEEKAKKSTDKFKEHKEAIAGLKDAYGEAAKGLREFAAVTPEAARFADVLDLDKMKGMVGEARGNVLKMGVVVELDDEAAKRKMKELRATRDRMFGDDIEAGRKWMDEQKKIYSTTAGAIGAGLVQLTGDFAGLGEGVQDALKALGEGRIGLIEFDRALALEGLKQTDADMRQLVKNLQDIIAEGVQAERAIKANNTVFLDFGEALKIAKAVMPDITAQFQSWTSLGDLLVQKFGGEVTSAFNRAVEAAGNLSKLPGMLPPLGQSMLDLVPVTSAGGKFFPSQTEMEKAGEEAAKAYGSGLRKYLADDKPLSHIADMAPEFQDRLRQFLEAAAQQAGQVTITSGRRTIERQMQLWQAALKKYGSEEAARKWVAKPSMEAPHVKGVAADLKFESEAVKQWAHANAEAYGLVFRLKNEDWHIELAQSEARSKRRKKENTDLDEWMKKSQQAIELRRKEVAIDKDITATTSQKNALKEEEKLYQDGLNAAIQQHGKVSAEQQAQIRRTAHEMAQLGLVSDQMKDAQDRATETAKKNAEAYERLAEQITQTAQTAVSGFVNDLRNGVSAGEAFRNMLDRVIDGMINMAIEAMFAKNALGGVFGGIFGGMGGGGGIIGGLPFPAAPVMHDGGEVGKSGYPMRRVSPAVFANAPRFHNGLMPDEFGAILQKGEIVIPKTARRGGGPAQQIMTSVGDVNIDMSQTGTVAANTEAAKQFGMNVQKIVQAEIVRESRPGGLLRRTPG